MRRYFIMNAKAGTGDYGMACGPVPGPVVAEVMLKNEGGEEFYMSLAEVDGIPNVFKTDKSTYNEQLKFDMTDEYVEWLNDCFVDTGEYEDIFTEKDEDWFDVYRYLIWLVRCAPEEEDPFIEGTKGCWTDEITIPVSDVEEEYEL